MQNNIQNYHVIDMTHEVDESVPSWNGSCGFNAEIKLDYTDGCRVQKYSMHAGIGTHIDAPVHFIPGAKTVSQLALSDLLFVPLYVVNVASVVGDNADYQVSVSDVVNIEGQHEIPQRSFVAFYTGWSSRWHVTEKYRNVDDAGIMHFPAIKSEVIDYLLAKNIVGIGIDTLSPDAPIDNQFQVHHKLLGAGKYIVENLANLDQVPQIGSSCMVVPPKIKDGAEAMVRVLCCTPKV